MDPVNRTGGARDTTAEGTVDRMRSARMSALADKTLRAPTRFGPVQSVVKSGTARRSLRKRTARPVGPHPRRTDGIDVASRR
jgi:hypothetical protein